MNDGNVDGAVSPPQTEGEIMPENSSNSPQKISPAGESPPSPKLKPWKQARMSSTSKNQHPPPTISNEKFREYRLQHGWKKTACRRENGNTAGKILFCKQTAAKDCRQFTNSQCEKSRTLLSLQCISLLENKYVCILLSFEKYFVKPFVR